MKRFLVLTIALLMVFSLFAPAVLSREAANAGSTNTGPGSQGWYQGWSMMNLQNNSPGQQNDNYMNTPYGYSLLNQSSNNMGGVSTEPLSPLGGTGTSCMGGAGGTSAGTSSGMGSC